MVPPSVCLGCVEPVNRDRFVSDVITANTQSPTTVILSLRQDVVGFNGRIYDID